MTILICAKKCGVQIAYSPGGRGTGDRWPECCGAPMIRKDASTTHDEVNEDEDYDPTIADA